jgi:hypothetical protein
MSAVRLRVAAAAVVAVPLLAYPLVVGAGGAPFPSVEDCVRIASPGTTERLDLVFGRFDTPTAANELLTRVQGVGYVDAEVRRDGCGRWEVLYDGITSYAQGIESRDEARGAGLEAEVELEPPG